MQWGLTEDKEHIRDIPHDHAQSVREEQRERVKLVHAKSVVLGGQALKMSGNRAEVVFRRNEVRTHRDHPQLFPRFIILIQ
jgi:hypothetical protein